MHGNVAEWCSSDDLSYRLRLRHGNLEFTEPRSAMRVRRGGGYTTLASQARSAARGFGAEHFKAPAVGLRPARRVDR